ncbi:MAG: metallophosphoesterase [bacterium]|nr:metallophosphoesterase [bacterium]
MKVLSISDFHGQTEILKNLKSKIIYERPDLIVFTGDIVKGYARGNEWLAALSQKRAFQEHLEEIVKEKAEDAYFYEAFYGFINELNIPFVSIPGNMDAPEKRYFSAAYDSALNSKNINIVQENIIKYNDFIISGFGGEITEDSKESFFVLVYPKMEIDYSLRRLKYIKEKKILLFHTPPIGSVVDIENNCHRGSIVVNDLIKIIKPTLVFCGHAHTAKGYEIIEGALVVNPGALKKGNYALIDTRNMKVQLKNCNDE